MTPLLPAEEKLQELCRCMKEVGVEIVLADKGRSLGIDRKEARLGKTKMVKRIQDLVYRDDETGFLLGLLKDGTYSPNCRDQARTGDGRTTHGVQRYLCNGCRRKYTMLSSTVWSGSKLGPRRILLCMWLLGLDIKPTVIAEILGLRTETVQNITRKLELYAQVEVFD